MSELRPIQAIAIVREKTLAGLKQAIEDLGDVPDDAELVISALNQHHDSTLRVLVVEYPQPEPVEVSE